MLPASFAAKIDSLYLKVTPIPHKIRRTLINPLNGCPTAVLFSSATSFDRTRGKSYEYASNCVDPIARDGRRPKWSDNVVGSKELSTGPCNDPVSSSSPFRRDLDKMKDGISEKLGVFTYLMVSFISSIIISFVYGWKLTLVVLSCAPIIVIATAVVAKVQSSLTALELAAYGQAGTVAEEVLGAIRTVIAFNGEQKEVDRYAKKLVPADRTGIKRGMWSGVGGGVMWFIIYISYAVAFWYASLPLKIFTGGSLFADSSSHSKLAEVANRVPRLCSFPGTLTANVALP